MCEGFGGFLHRNGTVYFIEPDSDGDISHSDVLGRMPAHLKNDDALVAFEFPNWTAESFRWDSYNVPEWADKNKCITTFLKVEKIWAEYEKVKDAAWAEYKKVEDAAWAEYEKVTAPALTEYEKVTAPAWAKYEKVTAPALTEYEKVTAPALTKYEKVTAPALTEYEKVTAPALTEYEKVTAPAWAKMIKKVSKIRGYLK